jgi:hypothetical protein
MAVWWVVLYLLVGVIVVATLLALWDPSQRDTFDRHDWLIMGSYVFAWPLLLAAIATDLLGWWR